MGVLPVCMSVHQRSVLARGEDTVGSQGLEVQLVVNHLEPS